MIYAKVTIDDTQVRKALDALTSEQTRRDMAERVADENVLPALRQYPPPSGKPMQWASEKQRRYVMAAIRSGAIQVPYQRTGNYGNSFQKQTIPDGMSVVSQLAYAPYVRGPGQAAYHRDTWQTLDDLATSLEDAAAITATAVLLDAVGDAIV